jgi:hypothetical protein
MAKVSGAMSAQTVAAAQKLVEELIAEGEKPPMLGGGYMWDPKALAAWYGRCCALGALLGKETWESKLCAWDSTKGDDTPFHTAMLGTLKGIAQYLTLLPGAK